MKFFKKSLIVTLKLTFEASNITEKILWISLALSGFSYISHLIFSQVISWNRNASFTTQKKVELSEIEFPAVTFCSRGATKYSIAERLGNLLDPNAEATKKNILPLRNALIQHTVGYPHDLSCSKQCVTELGNLCKFPFKLDGKVHNKCFEQKTNKFICPIKVDENGETLDSTSGQKYEVCSHNCNLPCVTKEYEACIFPFKYHKRNYNKCTKDQFVRITNWNKYNWHKYDQEWCATKVNQTNQNMITKGNCTAHCSEYTTEQLCSVSKLEKNLDLTHTY